MGAGAERRVSLDAEPGNFGARLARTDVESRGDPYFPYLRRAVDDQLAGALDRRADGSDHRPLVIAGHAMDGTSRTIAEALRTHPVVSRWTLLVPEAGADPSEIIAQAPAEGAVVWLDHVGDATVRWDTPTLRDWASRERLIVVASVRTEFLDQVLDDRDFHGPWSVLADPVVVELVRLPPWSVQDLPTTGLPGLLGRRIAQGQSLGQVLGAAGELLDRLEELDPIARAVARVIAAWSRMGLPGGIPVQVAEQVWLPVLSRQRQQSLVEGTGHERRERFETAIAELTAPLAISAASPVTWVGPDRLHADGYVVAHPPPEWGTIDQEVWSAGLAHALATGDPVTLLGFGLRAYVAEVHDVGHGAWDAVARMTTTPLAAWGSALVGELDAAQDDQEEAIAALRRAMGSGHPDAAPAAATALGRLLEVRDPVVAREAYESVEHGDNPTLAAEAALRLGWLLEWDDPPAAREAYAAAIRSGHPDLAPEAAVYLAWMLESEDRAAAREAYETAIRSGQPEWAPRAAADLGWMLAESDPEAARAAYETAIASGHREWAPRAAVRLGQLLARTDPSGAAEALEIAVASGHGEWAPLAAVRLGQLLAQSSPMTACAAFRVAMSSGHHEYAPMGELLYGEWCVSPADPAARRRHWSRAAASGSSRVLVDLACLCSAEGAPDLAEQALANAAKAGSSFAQDYLHVLSLGAADLAEDESFLRVRTAAEYGDTAGLNVLGLLALRAGDVRAARKWWSRSAAEHDPIAPLLLRHLP
ncbi:TPR repeat [Raineyella antarctica]|uniref:TPR repeat n=1 Tax=Raineyella antarctica TaxID=1577474 RepID=A0A1G6HS12_9ACTN|nr:sel1 repeat family protein [Raineyella antarctica]SDB96964.1 TPR repeat [Raineyella antarctica]